MKNKNIKLILLIILIVTIIINAWLCDDAYISFRVIKNFVSGYGLRWNIFERVQVFTNPLMVLSLIPFYAITHEIYYTSLIFDIVISSIALYILLFKIVKSNYNAILVTILLLFSRSFMSFTTSGLENCFSFLLLSLFFYFLFKKDEYGKKDIMILSLITSLILLNRMDTVLLVIPATFYVLIKKNKNISFFKFVLYYLIGMLPFIIWELFALIYYGFLFPNTYYAKLTAGISKMDYIKNGLTYLTVILRIDPATILTILLGILFILSSEDKKSKLILYGVAISIIYIVYVGGDFMLGRFLTPSLFVITIAIGMFDYDIIKSKLFNYSFFFIIVLLFGTLSFYPKNYRYKFLEGVADEQAYYSNATSLMLIGSERIISNAKFINVGTYTYGCIGFVGYFSDSNTKIIDFFTLGDPLLSRIPLKEPTLKRIGHIRRPIPDGYFDTVKTGKNVIVDENIKKYYDIIKIITQDKIFSKKRIKTIIKYHLGKYDYLIDNYLKSKEN